MKMFLLLSGAALLAGCSSMNTNPPPTISSRDFGVARDGRPATLWTMRGYGIEVDVSDFGATLVSVRTPDRGGFLDDIVLGFDNVAGYQSADNQYFGCTTGRVCNRIAKGEFTLDGYTYVLARNNGGNHLHGGAVRSFDKVHWQAEVLDHESSGIGVRFTYTSRDGEEGYPGNLQVSVTFALVPGAEPMLAIRYEATTDRRTLVNLTNHAYWNLAGAGAATVLDHTLSIDADHYTPTDETLIPTGALATVQGTPLDFRDSKPIGLHIAQLSGTPANGYDHNFVLRPASGMRPAATLHHEGSGRSLAITTTEPGLQFYSGNFLRGQTGKGGKQYGHRSGLCLETQHFPDSVHQPGFPSTVLLPGAKYESQTRICLPNH